MADFRNYNADRTAKVCGHCRVMLAIEFFRVKKNHGGTYLNNVCRRCEGAGVEQYRTRTPKGLAACIVRRTKYESAKLGRPFDLTVPWVLARLEEQGWRCILTDIPFLTFKREGEKKRRGFTWNSISCDRLDPTGGYTMANVRFILNVVNLFKNDGTDERMFMVAEALLARRKVSK